MTSVCSMPKCICISLFVITSLTTQAYGEDSYYLLPEKSTDPNNVNSNELLTWSEWNDASPHSRDNWNELNDLSELYELKACEEAFILTPLSGDRENHACKTSLTPQQAALPVAAMASATLLSAHKSSAVARSIALAKYRFSTTQMVLLALTTAAGAMVVKGYLVELLNQSKTLFVPLGTPHILRSQDASEAMDNAAPSSKTGKAGTATKDANSSDQDSHSQKQQEEPSKNSPSIEDLREAGWFDYDR